MPPWLWPPPPPAGFSSFGFGDAPAVSVNGRRSPVAVLGPSGLRVRPPPPNLVLGPCSLRARLRLRAGLRAVACAARWGWSSLGLSHRTGSSRSHTDESCQSLGVSVP